mmetsp:Transcript_18060/g.50081  ORF Transcript_18060/g.50081 Transcript_18060/m.50081 type:complete len:162 (+) Transcript_18060:658-1143(+)
MLKCLNSLLICCYGPPQCTDSCPASIHSTRADGCLSIGRARKCMKRLGISLAADDVSKAFFGTSDDDDQVITLDMFLPFVATKSLQKDKAERAFQLFDRDGKGVVVLEDLERVAKELNEDLTQEELREMIQLVDRDSAKNDNDDGLVLPQDFIKIAHRVNL